MPDGFCVCYERPAKDCGIAAHREQASGRSSRVGAPDPAAVMAEHAWHGLGGCHTYQHGNDEDDHCLLYRLAIEIKRLEAERSKWALLAQDIDADYTQEQWHVRSAERERDEARASLAAEQAKVARAWDEGVNAWADATWDGDGVAVGRNPYRALADQPEQD